MTDLRESTFVPEAPSVLVVDDDALTRQVIIDMISPLGVNPTEAATGRQALSLLKRNPFDVVISDLMMPKMSGMMLLHSMLEQGFNMPFILMTGYSDKDSAIQALRLGAFEYLEKPLEAQDLRSVLSEAIKVGREQRQLVDVLNQAGSLTRTESNSFAEMQIMKMRSLRHQSGSVQDAIANDLPRNWEMLKTVFVQEAESQLVFCGASFNNLRPGGDLSHDLGFSLRVVQSVRMASQAVRFNDVADLAWALEKALASAKAAPADCSTAQFDIMRRANEMLLEKIRALGNPEVAKIKTQLAAMAEAPENGDASLKKPA